MPELSYLRSAAKLRQGFGDDEYFIKLHETLPQPVNFVSIDYPDIQYTQQEECALACTQLEPWMMVSSNWLLEPVVLLRASYSAAWFADATFAVLVQLPLALWTAR